MRSRPTIINREISISCKSGRTFSRSDNNGKFFPLYRFARDTNFLRLIGIDGTYKAEYYDGTGYAGTGWKSLVVSAVMNNNDNDGYSLADYATLFGAQVITYNEWYD